MRITAPSALMREAAIVMTAILLIAVRRVAQARSCKSDPARDRRQRPNGLRGATTRTASRSRAPRPTTGSSQGRRSRCTTTAMRLAMRCATRPATRSRVRARGRWPTRLRSTPPRPAWRSRRTRRRATQTGWTTRSASRWTSARRSPSTPPTARRRMTGDMAPFGGLARGRPPLGERLLHQRAHVRAPGHPSRTPPRRGSSWWQRATRAMEVSAIGGEVPSGRSRETSMPAASLRRSLWEESVSTIVHRCRHRTSS